MFEEQEMTVKNIGKPMSNDFFNQTFIPITFEDENGNNFVSSILDGSRGLINLKNDLTIGNKVNVRYTVSPEYGWIDTVNGKQWH